MKKMLFAGLIVLCSHQAAWATTQPSNQNNLSSQKEIPADQRFKDQVIFITGGTSGIGLATAVQFVKAGASHVIVCGRNESKWINAQKYIQANLADAQAKKIEYLPCDVRIESQVKDTMRESLLNMADWMFALTTPAFNLEM